MIGFVWLSAAQKVNKGQQAGGMDLRTFCAYQLRTKLRCSLVLADAEC